LAVTRIAVRIVYLSELALHQKFGSRHRGKLTFSFDADSKLGAICGTGESSVIDCFDANSYLYTVCEMNCFDLAAEHKCRLAEAFSDTKTRFCVVALTFYWSLPAVGNSEIVYTINAAESFLVFCGDRD
jgi:homoserine O-acetyltransferase